MSRTPRPRRTQLADFRLGELVRLEQEIAPLRRRCIVQIVGFRGEHLRVIPPGGIPVSAPLEAVAHTGFAGSSKPRTKPFRRRPRPAAPPSTQTAVA